MPVLEPHSSHPLVFRGRVQLADLHRGPGGEIQTLALLVAHVWADAIGSRSLRSGRKLAGVSGVAPRQTIYSLLVSGERLGPLGPFLDRELVGMPVCVGGTPSGGKFSNGEEVILLYRAEVQPDVKCQGWEGWVQRKAQGVPAF